MRGTLARATRHNDNSNNDCQRRFLLLFIDAAAAVFVLLFIIILYNCCSVPVFHIKLRTISDRRNRYSKGILFILQLSIVVYYNIILLRIITSINMRLK